MKKFLFIPALLGCALLTLAGCEMVGMNNADKQLPSEKITTQDETPGEENPDCPDCPDGDGENGENPTIPEEPNDECPDCPDDWVRDRMPRNGKKPPKPNRRYWRRK